MGQFLAIGIITSCGTSKANLLKYNITKEELISEMVIQKYFEPSIYDFEETDERYQFSLKQVVLENQLIPFLEKLYPAIYTDRDSSYKETIETLKVTKPESWLEFANRKSMEQFQADRHGEPIYLYFNKPFKPRAEINFRSIVLSLEGKIFTEGLGRQFNFFKYCIQQTFTEFSLAKAIQVYITG